MKPELTEIQLDAVLGSWQSINKALKEFSEVDVRNALNRELLNNRRKDVAVRLHQRFCAVRASRERIELLNALDDSPVFLTPVFQV